MEPVQENGNPATSGGVVPAPIPENVSAPVDTPAAPIAPPIVETPGQNMTPGENAPVPPTDATPVEPEDFLKTFFGIDNADTAPVIPDASTDTPKDEFENVNNEPAIFRKQIDSFKAKEAETAPKLETLDKLQKAIDADPMLKAITEQLLSGKDIKLSQLFTEFASKRLGVTPKTETKTPAGNSPQPQSLQSYLTSSHSTPTLSPTRE